MNVILIADLFGRAYYDFILELEENEKLNRFVDVKSNCDGTCPAAEQWGMFRAVALLSGLIQKSKSFI